VVFGAGLAYFAFTAINGPIGVPTTSPTPNAGQAATQFGAVGFRLRVDALRRLGGQVQVQLTFTNSSQQQQRADPRDFTLSNASGSSVRPAFGGSCPDWGRVDLYPPGAGAEPLRDPGGTRSGPTWGPSSLCFPALAGSLTLVWEPDVAFGPLSEPIRIPLR
jgi:hypothetical protein